MDTSRFDKLWKRSGGRNNSSAAFTVLEQHYSEPHRRYHTANHITACLTTYDRAASTLGVNDAVEMALWFHDVIYVAGQTDNETRSAELFQSLSNAHLPGSFIDRVVRMIIATRHKALSPTSDEQFVVDVDLDGLAKPWNAFIADTQLLREENHSADEAIFLGGMRHFFGHLLERPSIYATPFFQASSELKARKNVQRLLAELDSLELGA